MDTLIDVTSADEMLGDSNVATSSEEPATKKRKSKTAYDDSSKYFYKVVENKKVKHVCKLKKDDGSICNKEYLGSSKVNIT